MRAVSCVIFIAIVCSIILLHQVCADGEGSSLSRFKRQSQQSTRVRVKANAASSVSTSTSSGDSSQLLPASEASPVGSAASRPAKSEAVASARPSSVEDNEEDSRPEQPLRAPQAKKPARRPPSKQYRHRYEDDEECDDADDSSDYYPNYNQFMSHPLGQFRSMMNNAFDRFQDMQSGNFYDDDYQPGPNARRASAMAVSSSDGYSRLSSSVTNNGRTRGIVSETRNGRTKTRRIGDEDDGESSYD